MNRSKLEPSKVVLNSAGVPATTGGQALIQLEKEYNKLIDQFYEEQAAVVGKVEKLTMGLAEDFGAGYCINPDHLTQIAAKLDATGQAIRILQYYLKAAEEIIVD